MAILKKARISWCVRVCVCVCVRVHVFFLGGEAALFLVGNSRVFRMNQTTHAKFQRCSPPIPEAKNPL